MRKTKEIEYNIDENGCHTITSHALNRDGYGVIMRDKKQYLAHRYIYIINFGEIPDGMVVRHKCDNPSCINISHLEIGTHNDNMQDKILRGRQQRGEGTNLTSLTEQNVIDILLDDIRNLNELAEMYNVSRSCIQRIKMGIRWNHIYEQYKDKVSVKATSITDRKGSRNGRSKLTEENVVEIILSKLKTKELCDIYNISPANVRRIKTGKIWGHIYERLAKINGTLDGNEQPI